MKERKFFQLLRSGILILCVVGCNQQDKSKPEEKPVEKSQPIDSAGTGAIKKIDDSSILLTLSKEILEVLKTKKYQQLVSYIKPGGNLLFSPYGYIDTGRIQLSAAALMETAKTKRKLLWGEYDGSGEPILLSLDNYMDKFVYNADYLAAKEVAVNKFIGTGNSLNNLKTIFPVASFAEFHFPGFDPKYGGMDWKSLRLVFEKENDKHWLVAIVYDQWTI